LQTLYFLILRRNWKFKQFFLNKHSQKLLRNVNNPLLPFSEFPRENISASITCLLKGIVKFKSVSFCRNMVNGRDRMRSRGAEVASVEETYVTSNDPHLHASLTDDFVPLPRCICAYVLCNTPVHHVVSTLNTLSTSRQARPTTGNPCTYGTITYFYRVYSTSCVLS